MKKTTIQSGLERRKIMKMQDDNDKLGRASSLADEITGVGRGIVESLGSQQETLQGVRKKTK